MLFNIKKKFLYKAEYKSQSKCLWYDCEEMPERHSHAEKNQFLVRILIHISLDFNQSFGTYAWCKAPAKLADIVWQTFRILPAKHACAFGHHDKHCLTNTFCLSISNKNFLLVASKNVCQALFVWWPKRQTLCLTSKI